MNTVFMNSIIGIGFSSDNGAMCTHFMTVNQPQQLRRWISRIRGADALDEELELPAQPHIFNHYPAPFVRWHQHAGVGSVQALIGVFGLIPNWAKVRKGPYSTMNARAETVAVLPSYHTAWARGQRCIIPASTFDEPNWETGKNIWWQFRRADGDPWGLAGLWNTWIDKTTGEVHESYTMLTINADEHPLMSRMHKPDPKAPSDKQDKRSVIPLAPADFDQWLEGTVNQAQALMRLPPVEIFEAGPLDPKLSSPEGVED